ncbi:hypothetical protein RB2083_340 [Rhodobacteraceae bacterium HTCC2083]|nr:hypothetical protein RB2083_340 [Rhodobacteraceae bacterium HTCC2083]
MGHLICLRSMICEVTRGGARGELLLARRATRALFACA